MGCTFKHPAFQDAGDDETGVAVYKFKNGAMGMVHVGRTAPYGYHIETEIVGTEGTIRISAVPEKNRAMVYDVNGARTECVESFPERFAEAYLTEMEEFVRCVLVFCNDAFRMACIIAVDMFNCLIYAVYCFHRNDQT